MSEGRAQKQTFPDCCFTSSTVERRRKLVPGTHSDRRRDVGPPLHSSNKTRSNAVQTPRVLQSQRIQNVSVSCKTYGICILGCRNLEAQEPMRTRTATHCHDRVRLSARIDPDIPSRDVILSMTMQPTAHVGLQSCCSRLAGTCGPPTL